MPCYSNDILLVKYVNVMVISNVQSKALYNNNKVTVKGA